MQCPSKTALPLLSHDYDEERNAMSRSAFIASSGQAIPQRCLVSFMGDMLEDYLSANPCERIAVHHSETKDLDLYETEVHGTRICLAQAPVGAPAAAMLVDRLVFSGATIVVACGGCGVLNPISSGKILLPTSAIRDEGTSYHYLPPAEEIAIDGACVAAAEKLLRETGIPYELCKTWTTDGFFRETPSVVAARKAQGCSTVEMECSALASVAQCYGAKFYEVLYSGDSLCSPEGHDVRNWTDNLGAREAAFKIALLSLASI